MCVLGLDPALQAAEEPGGDNLENDGNATAQAAECTIAHLPNLFTN